jgi:phospholipase D1/2
MRDPLNDTFFEDTWRLIADNNTKIFRRVFRCNPDSEVTNWNEYHEFVAYAERFAQAQSGAKSTEREEQEAPGRSGPPGANTTAGQGGLATIAEGASGDHPLGTAAEWADKARAENAERHDTTNVTDGPNGQVDGLDEKAAVKPPPEEAGEQESKQNNIAASTTGSSTQGSVKRRRRGTTKSSRRGFSASDDLLSMADTEELLSMVQGNLVVFPYDWLVKEELNSNWLYQVDQVAPLQI